MMEKVNSNKPIFDGNEQRNIIAKNAHFIDRFRTLTNIEDWNSMRNTVRQEFIGTQKERLMFFGYVDGVLHPQVFK